MSLQAQPHTPKVLALEALEAGQLSAAGRERLLRHLDRCALCSETRRGLQVYRALAMDVRQARPDVDFSRMALALQREAQAQVRRKIYTATVMGAFAIAAAVALALVTTRSREPTAAPVPAIAARVAQPVAAPDARLRAELTALRGHGSIRSRTGATRALTLDSVLVEGESLELEAASEAHLRLADATAFIAEAGAHVDLTTLREHTIALALRAGSITSQVHHLTAAERYEVLASGYTFAVRGTRFQVSLASAQLTAAVSEGHVVVTDASGKQVSDLIAPARFTGATGGSARAPGLTLPAPRSLSLPLAAWPALWLPVFRDVQAFTVDGSTFPADAELAMRVPRGELTLRVLLADGRERQLSLQIPEGGLHVEESVLARMLRTADDGARASGSLPAATIRAVITDGTPALQRCYELSLRQRPDIGGRLTLRISVDTTGQVRKVVPRNSDGPETSMPDGLVECVRAVAQRWHFPPPGGVLTFDAPIRLMHAQLAQPGAATK